MAMRSPRGFTLVELLVSVAVLLLLMSLLLGILEPARKAWSRGRSQVEVAQKGRALAELIARDLNATVISPYLQFTQNPPLPNTANLLSNSDSVFFQSIGDGGILSEVGYYVDADLRMKKLNVPSGHAGFAIYNALPAGTVSWLQNASLFSDQQTNLTLAEGILGFWVRCLDAEGNSLPSNVAPKVTEATWGALLKYDSAFKLCAHRLPSYVEITVMALDSRAMERVKASGITLPVAAAPADSDAATYRQVIADFQDQLIALNIPTAEIYRTVIRLPSGTL